jgi:hypothetical protein
VRFRSLWALGVAGVLLAGALAPAVHAADVTNSYNVYWSGIKGGEPSIGYDKTRNVAIYGQTDVARLAWDDTQPGHPMTTTDITPPFIDSLDPITTVDPYNDRLYTSQLLGACSNLYISDDAGASYTHSTLGCGVGAVLDHQTVGSGPFHTPVPPILYPNAVYYCAQNGYSESCGVSLDGGGTFGPAIPISNAPGLTDLNDSNLTFKLQGGACGGLTGHLKVGPEGTAYVPINGCGGTLSLNNLTNQEYVGGQPSLSVSEDSGVTWPDIRRVEYPGVSNPNESDPSLGIAVDGTLYFGWENGVNPSDFKNGDETQAMISISHDRGLTWTPPVDVSSPLGLHNVQFPEVIAGDADRAAFAFLGTRGIGDDQANAYPNPGEPRDWYLYISTTYDGGQTWTTVNATPDKPVQRGCIDLQGIAPGSPREDVCSQRNLLDFNDMTVDPMGRVLVAYGDGCTEDECVLDPNGPSSGSVDNVARQTCGRGLYAAHDAEFNDATCLAGPTAVDTTPVPPTPLPNTRAVGGLLPWLMVIAGLVVALALALPGVARRRPRRS